MGATNSSNISTSISSNLPVWRWNSPTPYLFSAIVILMGCIATALLMLACSHQKHPDEPSNSTGDQIRWEMPAIPAKNEAKVVVIMAGDDKPTYFAAPSHVQDPHPFNHICTCGSQL